VDAVESLNRAAELGLRIGFVTNNASRPPRTVADQLNSLGLSVEDSQVFGSAAAAAMLVADDVASRSAEYAGRVPRVLAIGSEALRTELRAVGVDVVVAGQPADYVVQGFDPELGWKDLAAAAFAIQSGATWVATNTDSTIPRAEGIAPGNGSLVAAVRAAVDVDPLVAGKPQPSLMRLAARELGLRAPLVLGDRLDTDVAGGVAAGYDTALVLTGVDSAVDAAKASSHERPGFLLTTLADLFEPEETVVRATQQQLGLHAPDETVDA
jgi:HAD superfamily hydrolase (TIGR01450 family)